METFLVGCVVWVLEVFSHPLVGEEHVKEGDEQEVESVAQHSCSTARLAWLLLLEVQQ